MSTDNRTGAERIADERQRQIKKRPWEFTDDLPDPPETADEHDDNEHGLGDLAMAAVCYAAQAAERIVYVKSEHADGVSFVDPWPWHEQFDDRRHNGNVLVATPKSDKHRLRLLEKAGALIAAEIDRLLRAKKEPADG